MGLSVARREPAALRSPSRAEIRAKAPQVQSAEVPASDHHITLDNPEGFVEVVKAFLKGA